MAKSEKINVQVEARTDTGKNACRRIRAAGKIPGNVYGMDIAPFAVAVNPKRVESVLALSSGRNTIFSLSLEGGSENRDVMLRELQRDPVTERLLHVDFLRIDPDKRMHVNVPIRLHGVAEGVKNEGGILDFVQRSVEVSCLPSDIPEQFDIDISELHLNQNVAVKSLEVGEELEILDDPETILAVCVPTRVIEEPVAEEELEEGAEEAAEEGAEEPEVAAKGKEGDDDKAESDKK
jgi:large subunit ribosomal protein L25